MAETSIRLPQEFAAPLTDDETLFTRAEAARLLRSSVPTLERWASLGTGPAITRVGGRVLYSLSDLRAYLDSGRQAA